MKRKQVVLFQAPTDTQPSASRWKDGSLPTEDTGDYCRARAKLKENALREIAGTVAATVKKKPMKRG